MSKYKAELRLSKEQVNMKYFLETAFLPWEGGGST